jgi:hypothetical protein
MLFSLLLVLFSASSRTAPPKSPELRMVTACAAVTKAEIEEALGRAVVQSEERTGRSGSSCAYAVEDGELTVSLQHSDAKVDVAAEIANLEAAFPEGKRREIPGMGSRAFLMELGGIGAQLHVFVGEHDYLLVSALGLGAASEVAPLAVKIGRRAVGRIR